MVLSAASSQQWLYLDGAQIGTQSGAITNTNPLAMLGAGVYNNNGWPAAWSGNSCLKISYPFGYVRHRHGLHHALLTTSPAKGYVI